MKLKASAIILFIAATAGLTSCLTSNGPIYSGTEMCTVVSATKLVTDGGATFNIVESYANPFPDTLKRLLAQCDVLRQADEKATEYDIRLNGYEPVLTKNPVTKSSADEDKLGNDGVNIYNCWVENGYLNAYVNITEVKLSKTKHSLDLEWDDLKSNADTVYVRLRHNGFGESFDNETIDNDNLTIAGYYTSFPLSGIITGAGNEFVLHIDWEWYKIEGSQYLHEKELLSVDIALSK